MTTTTDEFYFDIKDGPSFSRVVDAFKYAYDKEGALTAVFTLENGVKVGLLVTALEHEDGSGGSLNINGHVASITKIFFGREVVVTDESFRVRLYYNARSRQGNMSFPSIREYDLCHNMARKRPLL